MWKQSCTKFKNEYGKYNLKITQNIELVSLDNLFPQVHQHNLYENDLTLLYLLLQK